MTRFSEVDFIRQVASRQSAFFDVPSGVSLSTFQSLSNALEGGSWGLSFIVDLLSFFGLISNEQEQGEYTAFANPRANAPALSLTNSTIQLINWLDENNFIQVPFLRSHPTLRTALLAVGYFSNIVMYVQATESSSRYFTNARLQESVWEQIRLSDGEGARERLVAESHLVNNLASGILNAIYLAELCPFSLPFRGIRIFLLITTFVTAAINLIYRNEAGGLEQRALDFTRVNLERA